jgi:hypothetical protein
LDLRLIVFVPSSWLNPVHLLRLQPLLLLSLAQVFLLPFLLLLRPLLQQWLLVQLFLWPLLFQASHLLFRLLLRQAALLFHQRLTAQLMETFVLCLE